jgi:hypothetical protein
MPRHFFAKHQEDFAKHADADDVVRHCAIVARFAERLARTNPRVDAQRFADVCNGKRVR